MSNALYYSAKAVEYTSQRLGLGRLEVSEGWQCRECLQDDCTDCKKSWLHEVANLEYSDAFEQRLNITAGTAGCVMGITGALVNASIGLWEEGDVIKQITEGFKTSFPTLIIISPAWRTIYSYILMLLFALAALTILASLIVATFIMAMNPSGKRHWRHMTLGIYLVLIAETVAYILLLCSGVTTADLTLAFGPFIVGAGVLLCVMLMGNGGRGEVDGIEKAA